MVRRIKALGAVILGSVVGGISIGLAYYAQIVDCGVGWEFYIALLLSTLTVILGGVEIMES